MSWSSSRDEFSSSSKGSWIACDYLSVLKGKVSKFTGLVPCLSASDGCFDRMPTGVSSLRRRRAIGSTRAVHIVCVAPNFGHSCGSFQNLESMWEPEIPSQCIVQEDQGFIRSDGLIAMFDAFHVGRKNPELANNLNELTSMLTTLECSASPCSRVFTGYAVQRQPVSQARAPSSFGSFSPSSPW